MTPNPEVAAILRGARELIAVPERWTTDAIARSATGQVVRADSPLAACWCLVGAGNLMPGNITNTLDAICFLKEATGFKSMAEYNDDATHAEVLAALDRAIAAAEGNQP